MNLPGTKNVVKHRKAAVGFRDAQLLPIFQAALGMLQSVLQSQQSGICENFICIGGHPYKTGLID
jgi:exportin-7